MERETGIEPAAPTLARLCSTTELLPRMTFKGVIVAMLPKKIKGKMENLQECGEKIMIFLYNRFL